MNAQHRSAYLTASNREVKIRQWSEALAGMRGTVRSYDLSNPVLVAVDLQRLFVDPTSPLYLPSWSATALGAFKLLDTFVLHGLPIIFTRHVHTENDGPHLLSHFFNNLLYPHDPMSEFHDTVSQYLSHAIIHEKFSHAAFANTVPRAVLAASSVILIGVQSQLCVAATAIDLSRYGCVPVCVSDGCAAPDETLHLSALRLLASGHAHVASHTEILDKLKNSHQERSGT
jgi:nicotinamidase-related amidase